MSDELKAGALFAGIGGFCIGFQQYGIKTVWAVENDVSAVSTYKHNFPGVRVVEHNETLANVKSITVENDKLEPVDILHAGFPCQSFSSAGERKGFDDPRGRLFFEIIRLLKEFGENRPSVIILENSPNIRVGQGGSWFMELTKEIKKAGYWFRDTNCAELDSYDMTLVPQKRKRLFMVAFSTNAFRNGKFSFPKQPQLPAKNLHDFIEFSTFQKDESYYLDEENKYHKMISEKIDNPHCIYQLRKFIVRKKEPGVCPTLTANMGLGGHNVPFIMDIKGIRKLTEHECLKLQGFPAWFNFPENVLKAKRYQQIGNSVVPSLVELIAEKVKEKIIRERK